VSSALVSGERLAGIDLLVRRLGGRLIRGCARGLVLAA
jgi:hypothetical protein